MLKWNYGRHQRIRICKCHSLDSFSDSFSYVGQFEHVLQGLQLKTGQQHYHLTRKNVSLAVNGTNVYGILKAPRGDATEAIVISTSWKLASGEVDLGGVSLLMSLAGYFRRDCFRGKAADFQDGPFGRKISFSY